MTVNDDTSSTKLGVLMAQKLPSQIKEKVKWEHVGKDWTLDFLFDMLNQALSVLEASGQTLSNKDNKNPPKKSEHTSPSNNKWKGQGAKPKQSTILNLSLIHISEPTR